MISPEEVRDYASGKKTISNSEPYLAAFDLVVGMKTEWGVEYTGINHGNRHIEFFEGEFSEETANREFTKMSRSGMEPSLISRYVTEVIR